jgi:hypothetical protein
MKECGSMRGKEMLDASTIYHADVNATRYAAAFIRNIFKCSSFIKIPPLIVKRVLVFVALMILNPMTV